MSFKGPVALSLSALIAVDTIGWSVGDYLCWSLPRTVSACALPEAVMPHTEFPDMPSNQVMRNVSVIASTGTMYQPYISLLSLSAMTT